MHIGILVTTALLEFGERRVSRMICIIEGLELLGGGIVRLIVVVAIGVYYVVHWGLVVSSGRVKKIARKIWLEIMCRASRRGGGSFVNGILTAPYTSFGFKA